MQKNILLTFIIIIGVNIFASAQTRLCIKAGLNIANQSLSSTSTITGTLPTTTSTGFHLGLVLNAPLSKGISIQSGLLFSQKGFNIFLNGYDISATYNYIEVPINLRINVTKRLFIGGGPYLGYALSGTITTGKQSEDIKFGSGNGKRSDFGVNILAGIEIAEGFTISGNYSLGLSNISEDSQTIKNNVIGISLTKLFGEQ
jgi:hypothetical protein